MKTLKKSESNLDFKNQIRKNGMDVYATSNYEIFHFLKGNRQLNNSHVKKLKQSILEHGWIRSSILTIGRGMIILDGQHRLQALKEIFKEIGKKYEIFYVVNDVDLISVQALQTQRTWKMHDYMMSFIELGNDEYLKFKIFKETYNLTFTAAIIITLNISGVAGGFREKFIYGNYKCPNWEKAKMTADALMKLKPYFEHWGNVRFVAAFTKFFNHPEFSISEFIRKLDINRDKLYRMATIRQYMERIGWIYNFKRREEINFSPIFNEK